MFKEFQIILGREVYFVGFCAAYKTSPTGIVWCVVDIIPNDDAIPMVFLQEFVCLAKDWEFIIHPIALVYNQFAGSQGFEHFNTPTSIHITCGYRAFAARDLEMVCPLTLAIVATSFEETDFPCAGNDVAIRISWKSFQKLGRKGNGAADGGVPRRVCTYHEVGSSIRALPDHTS